MATPPRVSPAQAQEALNNIVRRREKIDDPYRDRLSDDPREALLYLRKFTNSTVPVDVQKADITDGLLLYLHLWWQLNELQLWLLDRAEELGMNRRQVGRLLGIRTGQGLVDRRDRLRMMLGDHGRPDEKAARAQRAEQRAHAPLEERRQRWLDQHRSSIRAVATALVEHDDKADDDAAEWLVEVREDLRNGKCTPGAFTVLGLAVDAMSASPAVQALTDDHPLQAALRQWRDLETKYQAIQSGA